MGLSSFLAQNCKKIENIKHIASKRFVGKEGKIEEWEIKAITSEEDELLRKTCTKRVPVNGRRGQYTQETDFNMYLGKLASACTIYPNLADTELQNSYSVMGSDQLLKRMLTPGEYAEYLKKVQEINGFEISFEEKVEEAKN